MANAHITLVGGPYAGAALSLRWHAARIQVDGDQGPHAYKASARSPWLYEYCEEKA